MTARKNLIAKGILCLAQESFTEHGIMDGRDENVDDCQRAQDYATAAKVLKLQGWARRPKRGEMCGVKHVEKFKTELFGFFSNGSQDSDKKVGPSTMVEKLQAAHPGVCTLPNFTKVHTCVNQCFRREKEGNSEVPAANNTGRGRRRGRRVEEETDEMENAIIRIVHDYSYVDMSSQDMFC